MAAVEIMPMKPIPLKPRSVCAIPRSEPFAMSEMARITTAAPNRTNSTLFARWIRSCPTTTTTSVMAAQKIKPPTPVDEGGIGARWYLARGSG